MNILSVSNFSFSNPLQFNKTNAQQVSVPKFGLTMAAPLSKDTVSFRAHQQSAKRMAKRSDAISLALARKIRNSFLNPHNKLKKQFLSKFEGLLSTPDNKNILTMLDRVKTEDSIREKTAARGWKTQNEIFTHMGDISGFCFILEDKKSLQELIKVLSQMIKNKDFEVIEAEYHRLAPKYKKNAIDISYDSLNQSHLQKLKESIIKSQRPATQFWKEVDSISGYSGLHLTIRNKDGYLSEIQIMTRSMHNLKNIENLFYKIRNGKTVNPKYRYIEQFMEPLKVKDQDNPTPKEKLIQKAITKYTQEAYIDMLSRPYEDRHDFLHPTNPLIKDFDFNSIGQLMQTCEQIAMSKK